MSLYAVVDGDELGQVASIKGWSDFVEWADRQHYWELAHLAHHGYATELLRLANEIYSALLDDRPSPDIESTATGIEEICRKYWQGEIFIVTDGSGDKSINLDDYDDEPTRKKKECEEKGIDHEQGGHSREEEAACQEGYSCEEDRRQGGRFQEGFSEEGAGEKDWEEGSGEDGS